MTPKEHIDVSEHLQALLREKEFSRLWDGYVNQLKTLKSLFNSDEHWILEFIQNAEDAHSPKMSIRIDEDSIWILNNGNKFTEDNFVSICDVNSKKEPSKGDRGYLGIGFKSIFKLTDKVDIHSGDFHFRFEEGYWDVSKRGTVSIERWPWEILPIEIAAKDLPEDYTTGFYIPMQSKEGQDLLKKIADFVGDKFPKEAITQLKHIETIEIKTPKQSYIITKPEDGRSIEKLPFGEKEIVIVRKQMDGRNDAEDDKYLVFRKTVPVDPLVLNDKETVRVRRSGIKDREIGFIFKLDREDNLQLWKGKVTGVYSFMPVEGEQTGLPFGIFGDFIPNPGRDLVNYGAAWNDWQCKELVDLTKDVIKVVFLANENWCNFPAELLQHLDHNREFWGTKLVMPLKEFLESEALYEGGHRLEELVIDEDGLSEDIGLANLEKSYCGKIASPAIKDKITQNPKVRKITTSNFLKDSKNIEPLNDHPEKLIGVYKKLAKTTKYEKGGRGGREKPLKEYPFVLAEDNEYYCPSEVAVFDIDLDKENLPHFLTAVIPQGKNHLHPTIAKDTDAVEQLKDSGVEVVSKEFLVKELLHCINSVNAQNDCPPAWRYPNDLIEATLFLVSQDVEIGLKLLVSQNETLDAQNNLFLPGGSLDWQPLYVAQILSVKPVHKKYVDEAYLNKYNINEKKVWQFLKGSGVHGFDAKDDTGLIEEAGYAIAEKRLKDQGHDIYRVKDRKKLGYDLECRGHCKNVFEVKGMREPHDIPLEESEWRTAQNLKENAVLICVYNLPSSPDKVGYSELINFSTISEAVEVTKGVVYKKQWFSRG